MCVRARYVCVCGKWRVYPPVCPPPFPKTCLFGTAAIISASVCVQAANLHDGSKVFIFYQVNHPALIQIRGVGFVIFLSTGGGVLSLMHAFEVAEC